VASLENIRPREFMEPLSDVPRRSYGFSPQFKANPVIPESPLLRKAEKPDKSAMRQAASERMKARWAAKKAAKSELQPATT
jgi:hypothetical protein